MTDTQAVTLSNRAARDQVVEAALKLAAANSAGSELELDMSHLSDIDATWGAVLSNVLAGGLRDVRNLLVHMPETSSAHSQMARSGLYFALARHRGLELEPSLGWDSVLSPWRRDWRPANLQDPLFNLPDERIGYAEPDPFDDQLVAFLNPDRAPREDAPDDQRAVVYPWLRDLMRHRGVTTSSEALHLHRLVSVMTSELLDNIREHAQLTRRSQSSLAAFATRGRPNRLHLCVMDTGIGIPASLRRRHDESQNDVDLLTSTLRGELPLRGRSRGHGLHRISTLVDDMPEARLFIASGPTREGGAVVADSSGSSGAVEVSEVANLTMRGTVVLITLPFGTGKGEPSVVRRTHRGFDAQQIDLLGEDA